jgi:hypothetical protein
MVGILKHEPPQLARHEQTHDVHLMHEMAEIKEQLAQSANIRADARH